ncbi:MAG: ABC transporter ATP-binding protein [Parvibaculaceae bacterium]
MQRLLTIRNLVVEAFAAKSWSRIVSDVSLHVDRGEVLGLIGESGAGKSSVGAASMAYVRPGCRISGGSIDFDGIELTKASSGEIRALRGGRIAYVAQSAGASFSPGHRLITQFWDGPVQHGLMNKSAAIEKAKTLYELLRLPDPRNFGDRFPHQVSGGQLQRAMIAMAMSCDPDLVIFDEPTTALDVSTQIEVLAAIKETIKSRGTSALYITHDLAVVSQLADRILVLRHGKQVEEGHTRDILFEPKQDYTRALIAPRRTSEKTRNDAQERPAILAVQRVSASYGRDSVLQDVSLEVRKGRTVAIVGESGSGKSSLARAIAGLLPASGGTVRLGGADLHRTVAGRSKDHLRRIQMIYQIPDTALNPRQKIRDVVGRPLQFYFGIPARERLRRTSELLHSVGLSDKYLDRLPAQLSGGEKQRVCIARALAAEPELLICDEVTSGLDKLVAEEILDLLNGLKEKTSISYLFITHDLEIVRAIADTIVVMRKGQVVEQGDCDRVLSAPRSDYTKSLLSSVPTFEPGWLEKALARKGTAFAADGFVEPRAEGVS